MLHDNPLDGQISSQESVEKMAKTLGFLPFFRNRIEGFSIEEHTPEELWFNDEKQGPWKWKGPIIANWELAYGKFFEKKAGFVSLEWLPDFMRLRRSEYPLESLPNDARHILDVLRTNESALSNELKRLCGYSTARKRTSVKRNDPLNPIRNERNSADFDKLINLLQMGTWVCIADFEYKYTKKGEPYGWGVARYCTPEAMYADEIDFRNIMDKNPEEAYIRIARHLDHYLPDNLDNIRKLI